MKGPSQTWTVTQLTMLIKNRIESDPRLLACTVIGEISNFKHHSSGHLYLTLKDDKSRIRAIMFASRARSLSFLPEDGMRVIVNGNVGVFERDGQVQIYIDEMQPDGIGALYVAFTQLKEKLQREGLFDTSRKRPLVRYPSRIGVVTSPTGAVIRDICSTLQRRYPLATVILAPARVQGPEAAATLVRAIRQLEDYSAKVMPLDVVIVARGGGSLEELWPFNEEIVARAIAGCAIPVVSAVGHETDFTISDFSADVRAATPTAAAEVVAPDMSELIGTLRQFQRRGQVALQSRLRAEKQQLQGLADSTVLKNPARMVDLARQQVDYQEGRLQHAMKGPMGRLRQKVNALGEQLYQMDFRRRLERTRGQISYLAQRLQNDMAALQVRRNHRLDELTIRLEGLNPLQLLRRGYSVVSQEHTYRIVHSVAQVKEKERLIIRFSDGTVWVRVEKKATEEDDNDRFEYRYEQGRLDL